MTRIDVDPSRRIVNPVQGDAVTYLETSKESGGVRSLGELEVAPGGKVTPHYHRSYTERFKVLSGRLTVMIDGEDRILGPGEEATVPIGTLHAWSNTSGETAVAEVELRPGQPGFELSLQVAYGLARDGKVLKNGMPRNPLHTALLLDWGDGKKPGVYAVLGLVFRLLAVVARVLGTDRRLQARYSRPM
jgi:quercetin dioxygenase-like cupin family protein